MAKGQIVQKSVGLHPEDWAEIEVLSKVYHTSQSGIIRMFIDLWRQRDLDDPQAQEHLKRLTVENSS